MNSTKIKLEDFDFFQEIDSHLLDIISSNAKIKEFDTGKYICRDGEEANVFYLILKGKVALEVNVHSKDSLVLQTLGNGNVLGWSWLFKPYLWNVDARTTEKTKVLELDGKLIRHECEKNHEFGYTLLTKLANVFVNRLQATRLQLLDVYGKK